MNKKAPIFLILLLTTTYSAQINCQISQVIGEGTQINLEDYEIIVQDTVCNFICEAQLSIIQPNGQIYSQHLTEGSIEQLGTSDYYMKLDPQLTLCIFRNQVSLSLSDQLYITEYDSDGCPSELTYQVTNEGSVPATQAMGTLRVDEESIHELCILRPNINYGNIQPQETEEGIGYSVRIFNDGHHYLTARTDYENPYGSENEYNIKHYSLETYCDRTYTEPTFQVHAKNIAYNPTYQPTSFNIELTNTAPEKAYNTHAKITQKPLGANIDNNQVNCGHIEPGQTVTCEPTTLTVFTEENPLNFTVDVTYTNCWDPNNSIPYTKTYQLQIPNTDPPNIHIKKFTITAIE